MPRLPAARSVRGRPRPLVAALFAVGVIAVAAFAADRWLFGSTPSLSARPVVVLNSESATKWVALLRSAGISARAGTLGDALGRPVFVIPAQAFLSDGQRSQVRAHIAAGAHAIVVDPAVLEAVGFGHRTRGGLDSVRARGLASVAFWPRSYELSPLKATAALQAYTPLAWNGKLVAMARADVGEGSVIGLAADPFRDHLEGHELFPTLGVEATRLFGGRSGPRRESAEFYFDPGNLKLTPKQVAAHFAGARAVYIAGWNYGYLNYPYEQVIAALHARGIRAYAWLEPPMVNITLWDEHSECREKTQEGKDARVDWRSLIALEDTRCFELAWQIWNGLLTKYDWDGVDIAELYFETNYPNRFTPFHPSALRLFGRDPAKDPEAFLDWREQEVTRLNRKLVSRIHTKQPALDIELTVIDDELDPYLGRQVGSDVKALARVARDNGASLQVEDPFTAWTQGPERYTKLTPKVAPLLPPGRAFFDINIVKRLNPDGRPTLQMTGVEFSLAVMHAARASGRVAIYSSASLPDSDLTVIPYAAAGGAETGDGSIAAPWTVIVSTPRAGWNRLYLDGKAWPAAAGRAVVPGGQHRIAWRRGDDGLPALVRIAAELKSQTADPAALRFSYTAAATAWTVVERRPTSVRIDGAVVSVKTLENPGGGYTLRLPAGDHAVTLSFAAR